METDVLFIFCSQLKSSSGSGASNTEIEHSQTSRKWLFFYQVLCCCLASLHTLRKRLSGAGGKRKKGGQQQQLPSIDSVDGRRSTHHVVARICKKSSRLTCLVFLVDTVQHTGIFGPKKKNLEKDTHTHTNCVCVTWRKAND